MIGLGEIDGVVVLEEGESGSLVELAALLRADHLHALGAPPAGDLAGAVLPQAADAVVVVLVMAAGVLDAPVALAQAELVRGRNRWFGTRLDRAVDQARVAVAQCRANSVTPKQERKTFFIKKNKNTYNLNLPRTSSNLFAIFYYKYFNE